MTETYVCVGSIERFKEFWTDHPEYDSDHVVHIADKDELEKLWDVPAPIVLVTFWEGDKPDTEFISYIAAYVEHENWIYTSKIKRSGE